MQTKSLKETCAKHESMKVVQKVNFLDVTILKALVFSEHFLIAKTVSEQARYLFKKNTLNLRCNVIYISQGKQQNILNKTRRRNI